MRTIVIGDVHGCYTELEELLYKVSLDVNRDRLIFLGDLIDRGEDSWGVVMKVRALQNAMGERCIIIKGNHEYMCVNYFTNKFDDECRLWERNGGNYTMKSFVANEEKIEDYVDWFASFPLTYRVSNDTEDFICVHAGLYDIDLEEGLENIDPDTALWDRDPIESGCYTGALCIIGHTPHKIPIYVYDGEGYGYHDLSIKRPLPEKGLYDIDTACVFGVALSAMVIEDGMYYIEQVDSTCK